MSSGKGSDTTPMSLPVFATGQTGLGGLEAVHTGPGRPKVRPWTRQSSQGKLTDWTDWPGLNSLLEFVECCSLLGYSTFTLSCVSHAFSPAMRPKEFRLTFYLIRKKVRKGGNGLRIRKEKFENPVCGAASTCQPPPHLKHPVFSAHHKTKTHNQKPVHQDSNIDYSSLIGKGGFSLEEPGGRRLPTCLISILNT